MVDWIWASISLFSGFLIYLAIPIMGDLYPIDIRKRVGDFYLGLFARAYKQFSVVRRVLGGYDVLPIDVDAEQKLMSITLSGSIIGSDKDHRFNDPDNRIGRFVQKPLALTYEEVPAAIDAELAEVGHWVRQKAQNEGLNRQVGEDEYAADPYVRMTDDLRLVDPADAFALVPNDVSPENIKSAEKFTEMRFELYGRDIGIAEMVSVFMGFAFGLGGMAALAYVEENLIDGTGGGPGTGLPLPPGALDVVVSLL